MSDHAGVGAGASPPPGGEPRRPLRGGPLIGTDLELLAELGRGGMGTVWAARERSTGRRLAVKLLGRVERAEQLERFRREGEVVARLDHPGIVRIHSAGETEHGPYLVYELVEGARPVDEALAGLPVRRQVELIRDAARALGHAHQRGIVHRDVKPPNLLVDAQGRLRVTDFGVAAVRGASRLTRSGALVGTPTHMAPEQLRDRHGLGPWTDVWALGVVLYQALTGELPFQGDSLPALAAAISQGELVPPAALVPGVAPGLEAICLKALRRRGRERYRDGDALADDLERWLRDEPPLALRRPRPAGAAGVAAGLALALLAGVGLVWGRRGEAAAMRGPHGDPPPAVEPAPPPAPVPSAVAAGERPPRDPGPLELLPVRWPPEEGPGSAQEHMRATDPAEAVRMNPADAVFLEQATREGDSMAMLHLSRAYESGIRLPRSRGRALHWLFRAVAAGQPAALIDLGDRYAIGNGIPLDLSRAARCYERAGEQGVPGGLYRWGSMLAAGRGIPRDRERAIQALQRARDVAGEGTGWLDDSAPILALLLEERAGPGDDERARALIDDLRQSVTRFGHDAWPLLEYLLDTRCGDAEARRREGRELLGPWLEKHPATRGVPNVRRAIQAFGEE